jgi:hypothetical protein
MSPSNSKEGPLHTHRRTFYFNFHIKHRGQQISKLTGDPTPICYLVFRYTIYSSSSSCKQQIEKLSSTTLAGKTLIDTQNINQNAHVTNLITTIIFDLRFRFVRALALLNIISLGLLGTCALLNESEISN